MKKWGLLLAATLLAGCVGEPPVTTPTPDASARTQATATPPAPAPATPTSIPSQPTTVSVTAAPSPTMTPIDNSNIHCAAATDTADSEIEDVIEQLGFAFKPSVLPDGFKLAGVSSNENEVRQIYQNADYILIIAYPKEFSPDSASDELGWIRPDDAVSNLQIGDQTAYLMTGGWSDATIVGGPAISPDDAKWDYDKSLALFFTCRTDDGRDVDIAIQAQPSPLDWISAREIVDVAHSLQRISRSQ